jgi:hypothetical protein
MTTWIKLIIETVEGVVTGRLGSSRQARIAKQLMLKMLKYTDAWVSLAPLSMKLKILKLI